jgi:glutaconate CoA-transferase, subunit A
MTLDKRMELRQAVGLVTPGASVALGGVTLYRRPMAFTLALMRRFAEDSVPGELTLLPFTGGLETDLLISAGMVRQVRACYVGLETFGLAPHFTQQANQGTLDIVEETEASLACGIRAALSGVGFMPSTAWIGTDLPALRPDVRTVLDPYSGEELTAFPAIHCDVAVVHALEADHRGNALLNGHWGVDREVVLVSKTVIVTAERIVDRLARADIPGPAVSAVVEAPGGAYPTSCHPVYPFDGRAILRYVETAGTEAFPALVAEWCAHHHLP